MIIRPVSQLIIIDVYNRCGDPVIGNPSITQTRHRFHLTEALKSLEMFVKMANDGFGKLKCY